MKKQIGAFVVGFAWGGGIGALLSVAFEFLCRLPVPGESILKIYFIPVYLTFTWAASHLSELLGWNWPPQGDANSWWSRFLVIFSNSILVGTATGLIVVCFPPRRDQ